MNREELIKKLQAMAARKKAASPPTAAIPTAVPSQAPPLSLENTLNTLTDQSPAWRPVDTGGKRKAALSTDPDRCRKCHYAKMPDGFCVFQDHGELTGWQHHYKVTATCKTLPPKPSLDRDTSPDGGGEGKGCKVKNEPGVLVARDFWAKNQKELVAAGFLYEDFFGPCRAGVSPLSALPGWKTAEKIEIKGKFICFRWTVAGRKIMQRAAAEHRVRRGK